MYKYMYIIYKKAILLHTQHHALSYFLVVSMALSASFFILYLKMLFLEILKTVKMVVGEKYATTATVEVRPTEAKKVLKCFIYRYFREHCRIL